MLVYQFVTAIEVHASFIFVCVEIRDPTIL